MFGGAIFCFHVLFVVVVAMARGLQKLECFPRISEYSISCQGYFLALTCLLLRSLHGLESVCECDIPEASNFPWSNCKLTEKLTRPWQDRLKLNYSRVVPNPHLYSYVFLTSLRTVRFSRDPKRTVFPLILSCRLFKNSEIWASEHAAFFYFKVACYHFICFLKNW